MKKERREAIFVLVGERGLSRVSLRGGRERFDFGFRRIEGKKFVSVECNPRVVFLCVSSLYIPPCSQR